MTAPAEVKENLGSGMIVTWVCFFCIACVVSVYCITLKVKAYIIVVRSRRSEFGLSGQDMDDYTAKHQKLLMDTKKCAFLCTCDQMFVRSNVLNPNPQVLPRNSDHCCNSDH